MIVSQKSKISWTDATWNPLAGCTPISPGCTHCYAATMARRLAAMGQEKYVGTAERRGSVDVFTGKINFDEAALSIPLNRKKPTMYFVNSMSDLFHEAVPDWFIDQCFAVMALCPQHVFQVLTKRPKRMAQYFVSRTWGDVIADLRALHGSLPVAEDSGCLGEFLSAYALDDFAGGTRAGNTGRYIDEVTGGKVFDATLPQAWPLPNVWLGVSCEDKPRLPRLDLLRTIPAAVRFVSFEPLLEDLGEIDLNGIHWAISGGESGPHARPHNIAWSRSIGQQCQAAGVAWWHKQHGSRPWDSEADCGVMGKKLWTREELENPNLAGMAADALEHCLESLSVQLNHRSGADPTEWGEGWLQQMPEVQHA